MHIAIDKILEQIPAANGPRFVEFFKKADFSMELYKPDKVDLQQPHLQNEVYIIVSGTGTFQLENEAFPFGPSDFIFVPALARHRFVNFSDDFVTWVIFFGPKTEIV